MVGSAGLAWIENGTENDERRRDEAACNFIWFSDNGTDSDIDIY